MSQPNDEIDFNAIAADVITDIFKDVYKGVWNWFTDKRKEQDYFDIAAKKYSGEVCELLFKEHYFDFPRDNTFHNRLKTLEFENILPSPARTFCS